MVLQPFNNADYAFGHSCFQNVHFKTLVEQNEM